MPVSTGTHRNLSDSLVILFLQSRHFHAEDLLHFGWQRFLHILLHSAQEKWLQDFMKALVAILSTFSVILFKILPELKSSSRNKKQRGFRIPLDLSHQTSSTGYAPTAQQDRRSSI